MQDLKSQKMHYEDFLKFRESNPIQKDVAREVEMVALQLTITEWTVM